MIRVTIRVRIGDAEAEATGPKTWVNRVIRKFITERRKMAKAKERKSNG